MPACMLEVVACIKRSVQSKKPILGEYILPKYDFSKKIKDGRQKVFKVPITGTEVTPFEGGG